MQTGKMENGWTHGPFESGNAASKMATERGKISIAGSTQTEAVFESLQGTAVS
jgi:hypothetical protein